jgi:hypothetical protein
MSDTNPMNLNLVEDRGYMGSAGFLHRIVCVPKTWTDEQTLAFAETEDPAGTSGGWQFADPDPDVMSGEVSCQCPDEEGRIHRLLVC